MSGKDLLTEREVRLIQNAIAYANGDPAGLPAHNLMLIIAKLRDILDDVYPDWMDKESE